MHVGENIFEVFLAVRTVVGENMFEVFLAVRTVVGEDIFQVFLAVRTPNFVKQKNQGFDKVWVKLQIRSVPSKRILFRQDRSYSAG